MNPSCCTIQIIIQLYTMSLYLDVPNRQVKRQPTLSKTRQLFYQKRAKSLSFDNSLEQVLNTKKDA